MKGILPSAKAVLTQSLRYDTREGARGGSLTAWLS